MAMEVVSNEHLTRLPVRHPPKATQNSCPAPAVEPPSHVRILAQVVQSRKCTHKHTFYICRTKRRCKAACLLACEAAQGC